MSSRTHALSTAAPAMNSARSELDALLPQLYGELRRIAAAHLRRERAVRTLNVTALVHEAWLRLSSQTQLGLDAREHFLSVASRTIRRVLVDHERRRRARVRGEALHVTSSATASNADALDLIALDDALERLAASYPRAARVIELRFFGGSTVDETARALATSPRTIDGEWSFARAWLARELRRA